MTHTMKAKDHHLRNFLYTHTHTQASVLEGSQQITKVQNLGEWGTPWLGR